MQNCPGKICLVNCENRHTTLWHHHAPKFALTVFQLLFFLALSAQNSKAPVTHFSNKTKNLKTYTLITSTGIGGLWSSSATWSGGVVPAAGDDVIIAGSATVVVDVNAVCQNITINGALTMKVMFNLEVNGNWINDGIFLANTSSVIFRGAANNTISGSSLTAFYDIVVDKGTNVNSVLEANSMGTVSNTGNITIVNGLFKITTGIFQFSNAGPVIPATGGLWVNGATLNGGNFTCINNGWIRISAGIANFGTSSGNSVRTQNRGFFDVSGGVINIAGRLENTAGNSVLPGVPSTGVAITGGAINLCTVGSNTVSTASFHMSLSSNLSITGGTIVFQNPNSNATPFNDLYIINSSGTKSITGGTFEMGNAFTPANKIFLVSSVVPLYNLTLNKGLNISLKNSLILNKQLSLNGHLLLNAYNLIMGSTAPPVTGLLGSANGMIVCNNDLTGGELRKIFSSNTAYTFPVGDYTGAIDYAPVTLNFSSGTYAPGAYVGVKVLNTKHPGNASSTNYLNRYWSVDISGIVNADYAVDAVYVAADVAGTDAAIAMAKYTGLPWVKYSAANTATKTMSATGISDVVSSIAFSGISLAAPVVTITSEKNSTVCTGSSFQLVATATGDPGFTYFWSPSSGLSSQTSVKLSVI